MLAFYRTRNKHRHEAIKARCPGSWNKSIIIKHILNVQDHQLQQYVTLNCLSTCVLAWTAYKLY